MARRQASEAGFTLMELMIAMVVTLMVTGAMFGLMTGGQNAFRREPEMAERQQNIRIAMDIISRDVALAGQNMGTFVQAFTNKDAAPRAGLALDNAGPTAFPSTINVGANSYSDIIEIFGDDGECPSVPADPSNPNDGVNFNTLVPIPSCYHDDMALILLGPGEPSPHAAVQLGWGHNIHAKDGKFNFPPGQQPPGYNPSLKPAPTAFALLQVYRYQIAADPSDGTPGLWRSTIGTATSAASAGPATVPPAGGWQLIARGVEDLQVQYMNGTGVWADRPGDVLYNDFTTIVQQVRITLSARVNQGNLQGERRLAYTPASGTPPQRIRGQLTTVVSPRAALIAAGKAPSPLWR